MKINRMPTVLILSVMSWLIGILGFIASVCLLVVYGRNNINSLLIAILVLLAGILLAALIRMFGNMGQIFFDLRADVQRLSSFLSDNLSELLQRLTTLSNDTKATQGILSHGFSSLSQELKTQLQAQASGLIKTLEGLNSSLSADLKALLETSTDLSTGTKETQGILSHGFSSLSQELKTQLHNKIEQINMNAKNINDSIHKIKVFFERIERHLDLKK